MEKEKGMSMADDNKESLKMRIKSEVMKRLDMSNELEAETVKKMIMQCIISESDKDYIPLKEKVSLQIEIYNAIKKLDILSPLLEDSDVEEIMINGYKDIFIEKRGQIEKLEEEFESEERLLNVIQQMTSGANRTVNETNPISDVVLPDGARVNVVLSPVSLNGSAVTIRKFRKEVMSIQSLIDNGTMNEEVAGVLELLVKARYNILISGGTSTGKTTFLNALAEFIPGEERIVTIEDSAELKMPEKINNLVRLESRNANVEGKNEIRIRDLIKTSLRMRPDRIIVGEVRGGEAVDMLNAMNTGHDGSISTAHANSCKGMLRRLETMVLMGIDIPLMAVKQSIESAIDIVIHLGRLRDKSRRILEICEINGIEDGEIKMNVLYEFREEGEKYGRVLGELQRMNDLINVEKLASAGLLMVYQDNLKTKEIKEEILVASDEKRRKGEIDLCTG